ncbi:MAG TPA: hypothetical protein VF401_01805 [Candidatus Saccharimonadales bacterium]
MAFIFSFSFVLMNADSSGQTHAKNTQTAPASSAASLRTTVPEKQQTLTPEPTADTTTTTPSTTSPQPATTITPAPSAAPANNPVPRTTKPLTNVIQSAGINPQTDLSKTVNGLLGTVKDRLLNL